VNKRANFPHRFPALTAPYDHEVTSPAAVRGVIPAEAQVPDLIFRPFLSRQVVACVACAALLRLPFGPKYAFAHIDLQGTDGASLSDFFV
jgi:hypothetical protein